MYMIRDGLGVVIGRFRDRVDRDSALERHVDFGFPVDPVGDV